MIKVIINIKHIIAYKNSLSQNHGVHSNYNRSLAELAHNSL